TALVNKQDTIKLSQGDKEETLPLVQALSQLLVEAVKSEPVPYGQVGAPQSKAASGAIAEMEAIIAANKQRIIKK
ncbi:MAG: hypothetical protein ACRDBG_10360, partial [Waterburya sp.]